jgi:Outer membrane protein beta-barrel domain
MKKLLLFSFALLFAVSTFGQIRFGLKAGVNLANMSIKDADPSPSMIIGFHAGAILDLSLSDMMSLQPGVLFSTKGFKISATQDGITGTMTESVNYIEVPINLMFKFGSGDVKFMPFIGPYLGYALSGTLKAEAMGQSASTDITFGSSDGDMSALDYGLNIGVGIEMKGFIITAQYGLGLADLDPSADGKMTNNVIGISVGYLFGGK